MTPAECILEIGNVSHSTAVITEGSCFSKCEPTTVLRDVSARVHGGEVLAVLGSKGSGKRALLDVIGESETIFIIRFLQVLTLFDSRPSNRRDAGTRDLGR